MEEQKRKAAEESSDHKLREKKEERGARRTRAVPPAWWIRRSKVTTNRSRERNSEMTTETTTRKPGKNGRTRSAMLLSLAVGTALAGMVALAGTAQQAEAAFTQQDRLHLKPHHGHGRQTTPPATPRSSG